MTRKRIGVIGLGSVGWAVIHGLSPHYDYHGYDIIGTYCWQDILSSDILFICVPTPLGLDNRLDCSAITDVLGKLHTAKYPHCIVIKSTLGVGFMENAVTAYPDLDLVYMPEFLRERSSFTWFACPDRLVVSGSQESMDTALSYFTWIDPLIPRIKMDWKSAEIGKLAHNAYIAVKVSFTNEIESISRTHGAEPMDVMRVVWTDRRIGSSDHLTPGLGGYGGKCVPKDTLELMYAGGETNLIKAAVAVNEQLLPLSQPCRNMTIITIIPTRNRYSYLQEALKSVAEQKRPPDMVYVIADEDDPSLPLVETFIRQYQIYLPVTLLHNTRTQNLSGAVNTGLNKAKEDYPNLEKVFISILDDDDWWDRSYLFNLSHYAEETQAEWIISGLIRHDSENPSGYHQPIPDTLTKHLLYITNPNIQGSNLFVTLSKLLEIGGFDERLISTTDRDVCLRLISADTTSAVLHNHLVHHNALPNHTRLSDPGSSDKLAGLQTFYQKYCHDMTVEEQNSFKKRASELFHATIEEP